MSVCVGRAALLYSGGRADGSGFGRSKRRRSKLQISCEPLPARLQTTP